MTRLDYLSYPRACYNCTFTSKHNKKCMYVYLKTSLYRSLQLAVGANGWHLPLSRIPNGLPIPWKGHFLKGFFLRPFKNIASDPTKGTFLHFDEITFIQKRYLCRDLKLGLVKRTILTSKCFHWKLEVFCSDIYKGFLCKESKNGNMNPEENKKQTTISKTKYENKKVSLSGSRENTKRTKVAFYT